MPLYQKTAAEPHQGLSEAAQDAEYLELKFLAHDAGKWLSRAAIGHITRKLSPMRRARALLRLEADGIIFRRTTRPASGRGPDVAMYLLDRDHQLELRRADDFAAKTTKNVSN